MIDGAFVGFVVAAHETPWAAFRNHPRHIDDASLLSAAAIWCVWSCFLYADWPMRWLMKPPVKWALYSGAALVFVGAFCAGKGWL
jgi:NhaP-type Na+/H+ or K+/H+ antiporter